MSFNIPSGDEPLFHQQAVYLQESGLAMFLFLGTAVLEARFVGTPGGRWKVAGAYFLALLVQLSFMRVQNFSAWGVSPVVVILLVGGLWRVGDGGR